MGSGEGAGGLFGKSFPTPGPRGDRRAPRPAACFVGPGAVDGSTGTQARVTKTRQRLGRGQRPGSWRALGSALVEDLCWTGRATPLARPESEEQRGAIHWVPRGLPRGCSECGKEVPPQSAPQIRLSSELPPPPTGLGEAGVRAAAYYPSQEGGLREVLIPHTSPGHQGFPLRLPGHQAGWRGTPDAGVTPCAHHPSPAPCREATSPPRK